MNRKLLAICFGVEVLGIGIVGTGIGIEVGYGAHLGFVFITSGSMLVATGGVLFGKFLKRG